MLNKILIYIGFIVCAYLIGNISFARIISKIANRNKKDEGKTQDRDKRETQF